LIDTDMLPGSPITPTAILRTLKRHWWLIALPPLITLFLALLYSSRMPNLYQSDMLIAIDPQRVPEGFVQSTVTMRAELRLDAIKVQVLSRTNLERLVESLDLYPGERKVMPMEDVITQMRDRIAVDMELPRPGAPYSEGPSAFHVRFTYSDANIAAQVTQQLGSLFVDQNSRERGAQAGATNTFLERQLADARARLEVQERRGEAFRQRYGKELPTQMQSNMQASLNTQLQIQTIVESIARDRDRKLLLERLYREAAAAPSTPVTVTAPQPGEPNVSVPATAPAQQQLVTARALLASLELRFRPEHPDIIRTKRLIADLEVKA
jgi:succinoglycan biosynthesis transport protein ExoP